MRPPRISRLLGALALLAGAPLAGCTPTCDAVCTHLVEECGDLGTERETVIECKQTCTTQQDLYDRRWTDLDKRDAFDEQLRCLNTTSCDDLADGACYDPEIWSF